MTKKHIHETDTEELLKLLEDAPEAAKDEVFESDDKVIQFIKKYNIQSGNNNVRASILYNLFKLSYPDSIKKLTFTLTMNKFFNQVDIGSNVVVYALNLSVMNISEELEKIIRKRKFKPVKTPRFMNQYEEFLKVTEIKPGKIWTCINDLYDLWVRHRTVTKGTHHTLISRERLEVFLNLTFKHKTVNNLEYYLTNIPRKVT